MSRISSQCAVFSKVLTKGRTAIPREICEQLQLEPGDTLRYRVSGSDILLDKAVETNDPFAIFSEWKSEADEMAYADL
jgi:bifunctional DNA-binding transcriptional regulator/antitoxin component of YhaV-PrlF toxin-antitoxin module